MDSQVAARRGPWLAISVATAVALGLIGLLSLTLFAPIEPDCFEWCGLGRIFALAGISFLCFAWLALFLVLAWRHRARTPKLAMLSAVIAASASALLAAMVLVPWSALDEEVFTVFQLVSLLGIGVALPAAWRIARRSRLPGAASVATAGMTLAVMSGIGAYVALGTTWWTDGPTIQWMAGIGWSVALVMLAVLSWTGPALDRAALALLALGAALEAGIGVLALGFHVASGGFAATPYLFAGAGWGLMAFAWMSGDVAA